jgi:hypothetical protein
MGNLDRRHWLRQSGLALAGMAFAGNSFGRNQPAFGW